MPSACLREHIFRRRGFTHERGERGGQATKRRFDGGRMRGCSCRGGGGRGDKGGKNAAGSRFVAVDG